MVVRGNAAAIITELVAHGTFHREVLVAYAFYFLAERHGAAERFDDATENVVHLLVRLGFLYLPNALVVVALIECELKGNGAVGVGVLRLEVPSGVKFGGEYKLGLCVG